MYKEERNRQCEKKKKRKIGRVLNQLNDRMQFDLNELDFIDVGREFNDLRSGQNEILDKPLQC